MIIFPLFKNPLKYDIVERHLLIPCIYFDLSSWRMLEVTQLYSDLTLQKLEFSL